MPTASPLVRAASLSVSKKCEDIFGIRAANDNQKIIIVWALAHGFKPLNTEWWHFTLEDEPYPD